MNKQDKELMDNAFNEAEWDQMMDSSDSEVIIEIAFGRACELKNKEIELLNTKLRCTEAALRPNQIELNNARKLIEQKDKQIALLKEVLEEISKTDTCTNLDYIWMNNWRNNTKRIAEKALKEFKEIL